MKESPIVRKLRTTKAAGVAAVLCTALVPATAHASSGGLGTSTSPTVRGSKAKLVNGKAIPPENAPRKIVRVIKAANKIRNKPYVYGGGHGDFKDKGYDCSGAVSYALHGGRFLKTPLDSSSLAKWGRRGKGSWISVYGAPSHAYMVVAGLRFDTSMTPGDGPGWSETMRSTPESYKVRHPNGY
jgi:cell wall-associated NlpC family hydrolase